MKKLMIALMTLSSLSVFASADCSMYTTAPVTKDLEKVLTKKGYKLTQDKNATFELKYDQSDVEESYLEVYPSTGYVRIVRKKIGTYTAFNILEDNKHVGFAYGEASSVLFRSEYYEPTQKNKNRSYKKAVKDLKRNFEDCRY